MWVQVLFLLLGGSYLEKFRITDSILLVNSKVATVLSDNYSKKRIYKNVISPPWN